MQDFLFVKYRSPYWILACTTDLVKNRSGDGVCTWARTGMGCHLNHRVYCLIPESSASHSPSSVHQGPRRILIAVSIVTLCVFIKPVQSLPLLLCAVCSMQMTCHSLQGTHAWIPNMVRLKRVSLYTTKNMLGTLEMHTHTYIHSSWLFLERLLQIPPAQRESLIFNV